MISLRDYQMSGVLNLRASIKKYTRSLLVAPTGAGKTRIATRIMQGAEEQGNSCWFVVHRRELCKQTSKAMWAAKLEHGMIMSGKTRSPQCIQVCTVLTAANYIEKLPPDKRPKIIIFDEAHRSVTAAYERILAACPNSYVIGLTATPQRTDGRGLNEIYRDMVIVAQMRWLIDHGYLSEYELIAPKCAADLSQLKSSNGDYTEKSLDQVMDKPTITGDAIEAYKKFANGKRCMVFCVSIKHSKNTADAYNGAGIKAESIDGNHSDTEREAILGRFERGETLVLCSVQLAIEGLDIPAVEVVQQLRPTASIIVYLQLIGRGLRPEKGKEMLIVLDHVDNWKKHGLPDDVHDWSLEGRKKGSRKKDDDEPNSTVKQCKKCFAIFRAGPSECPKCGEPVLAGRQEIKQIEGELVKIDIEAIRKERKKAQGAARTTEDLIKLGISRDMKNPSAWAAITIAARKGGKPTAKEFLEARIIYQRLIKGGDDQLINENNGGVF